MPDKAEITAAVLKALVSDFHGMTRNKLVGVIGVDLGVVIDGTKDLQRLLPKTRGDGLITSEKTTWFMLGLLLLSAAALCFTAAV